MMSCGRRQHRRSLLKNLPSFTSFFWVIICFVALSELALQVLVGIFCLGGLCLDHILVFKLLLGVWHLIGVGGQLSRLQTIALVESVDLLICWHHHLHLHLRFEKTIVATGFRTLRCEIYRRLFLYSDSLAQSDQAAVWLGWCVVGRLVLGKHRANIERDLCCFLMHVCLSLVTFTTTINFQTDLKFV